MKSRRCKHCNYYPVHADASKCPQCGGPAPGQRFNWIGVLVVLALLGGGIYWASTQKWGGNPQAQANNNPAQPNAPPAAGKGTLVLKSNVPIGVGVAAWVEVDGVKAAAWAVGTTAVQVPVDAGEHEVVVNMTFNGQSKTVYRKRLAVASGATTTDVVN